jgi:hypothetical protein
VSAALVPGAIVWLALAAGAVAWLVAVMLSAGRLVGPRQVGRWLLGSWLSRGIILAAWGAAGWHIFCQRP